MIKFLIKNKAGKNALGLGLSGKNIELLKQGKPIVIETTDLEGLTGFDANILIMYGETEQHIYNQLKPNMDEKTEVVKEEGF